LAAADIYRRARARGHDHLASSRLGVTAQSTWKKSTASRSDTAAIMPDRWRPPITADHRWSQRVPRSGTHRQRPPW
jgi:hypothetical protein